MGKNLPGYFGEFGGRYSPEILTEALEELESTYQKLKKSKKFKKNSNTIYGTMSEDLVRLPMPNVSPNIGEVLVSG